MKVTDAWTFKLKVKQISILMEFMEILVINCLNYVIYLTDTWTFFDYGFDYFIIIKI